MTWVPDSGMSLLPSDHPGTLLSLQRLQQSRVNPQALAGLAQQCVCMVDNLAAQTRLGDPQALGYARTARLALRMTPR